VGKSRKKKWKKEGGGRVEDQGSGKNAAGFTW